MYICSKASQFCADSDYSLWSLDRRGIVNGGIYGEAICPFVSLSATENSVQLQLHLKSVAFCL